MWRKFIRPYAALVTLFVFLLIGLLALIRLNIQFLDSFSQGIKDYEITDIVYSRLRNSAIQMDDRIVIVNTWQPDRERLAKMLNRIVAAQPKAIGIDVLFSERKDPVTDSLLQAELKKSDHIVLASVLENYREDLGRFESETGVDTFFTRHAITGYVNFPITETRTIRYFSPSESVQGVSAFGFALQVARQYDPAAVDRLLKRKKNLERIHFSSTEDFFIQFDPETILDTAINLQPLLGGKIVLIGYTGDFQGDCPMLDKFHTPLNPRYSGRSEPDMYGIVIHANIIRMILDRKFITLVPGWLSLVLALLCCYGNVILVEWIHGRYPQWYHPITRILQVFEFILLFFLISLLFYWFRLRWDFTIGMLGLVLYFDVLLSYEAFSSSRHQSWINKLPKIFKRPRSG